MKETIKFAKVKDHAKIPSKRDEDAGYDIYPCFEADYVVINPLETMLIPTGIASALPEGYYFQIQERGSTGSKGIKYGAGVIDSGYRNEWFVPITNCNNSPIIIAKDIERLKNSKKMFSFKSCIGITREFCDINDCILYPYDKGIAQAILLEVPKFEVEVLDYKDLKEIPSQRGMGALGSSGK